MGLLEKHRRHFCGQRVFGAVIHQAMLNIVCFIQIDMIILQILLLKEAKAQDKPNTKLVMVEVTRLYRSRWTTRRKFVLLHSGNFDIKDAPRTCRTINEKVHESSFHLTKRSKEEDFHISCVVLERIKRFLSTTKSF